MPITKKTYAHLSTTETLMSNEDGLKIKFLTFFKPSWPFFLPSVTTIEIHSKNFYVRVKMDHQACFLADRICRI